MVEGVIFIGAIIIAVTQFIKLLVPQVSGAWTIPAAVVVGVVVALVDKKIGVTDITVAQGVMVSLGAVGVHTTASRIGETAS